MSTILITGANKGLGYETARRLLELDHDVWIGARDATAGQAAADELGGRFVALDVNDDASIAAAREQIAAAGGLDVLVNNAGIAGSMAPALETDAVEMSSILETNVVGPVRVTLAFRELLEASDAPVVVNVSSGLASVSGAAEPGTSQHAYPGLDYPVSKAGLNMVTVRLATALPRFRVNAVCPGFTNTALNNFTGTRTVEQGAEVIVRAACFGPDGPTGAYFDETEELAW